MTKQELTAYIIQRIEKERIKRGFTQQEIAAKLELSVAGYRKIVAGQTDSISLFTAYKAAELFDISLNTMCMDNERNQTADIVYRASDSTYSRIKFYVDYQYKIKNYRQSSHTGENKKIDLIIPNGFLQDGMILDSYGLTRMNIEDKYDEEIHKAFRITSNAFIPAYVRGDTLLINESAARDGDISLLMHIRTRRFYIRRMFIQEDYICQPLNWKGEEMVITQEDRKNWIDFGHVVVTLRG